MNIVRYWLERHRLRREIMALVRAGELQEAEQEQRPNRVAGPLVLYESLEYDRLIQQAHRLGVIYVRDHSVDAGYELDEGGHLSGPGYPQLRRAVADAKFARAEKWAKLIGLLVTALTGLLGAAIGLVTLLRR